MELFQINLIKAIKELKKRFPKEPLKCLETGTLRNIIDKHNSTLHISNTLGSQDEFTSVDINPDYIKVSKEACNHSKNTKWILSDSLTYLRKTTSKYHFVFLDTVNCKNFIFEEFKLIAPKMIENGILIVDDAGVTMEGIVDKKTTRVKGHKITAFLLSLGLIGFTKLSPIGVQLWIDMNKHNLKTILKGLKSV